MLRASYLGFVLQLKVFGSPETFFQKGFWPPEAKLKNLCEAEFAQGEGVGEVEVIQYLGV